MSKALVFDVMSNESLNGWLHPTDHEENQRRLSLTRRLNIAIGIASALDYFIIIMKHPWFISLAMYCSMMIW